VAPPDSFQNAAGARAAARRALRLRRDALSATYRAAAAQRIASLVAHSPWLRHARPVGVYAAHGSEVAAGPIMALALQRHCPLYLPRITDYRRHHLAFVQVSNGPDSSRPWRRNRHGILEPAMGRVIRPRALAVVFVPVLGFDAQGTRLGSGAGYYDRLFAFRCRLQWWHRPLLVGIAFSCQQLPRIERHAHDVRLDALVSEQGIMRFT
jgi:5-formyltetrahydrofolate cyclo-ligase